MDDHDQFDGSGSRRWTVGANLPTRHGFRINVSIPLAEFTLDGRRLTLRLRGLLARWTKAEALIAEPTDLVLVFPARSILGTKMGLGLRRPDGREYFVKTYQVAEILERLRVAGFPVSMEPQRATTMWKIKR
jgi:hypothetical protein